MLRQLPRTSWALMKSPLHSLVSACNAPAQVFLECSMRDASVLKQAYKRHASSGAELMSSEDAKAAAKDLMGADEEPTAQPGECMHWACSGTPAACVMHRCSHSHTKATPALEQSS